MMTLKQHPGTGLSFILCPEGRGAPSWASASPVFTSKVTGCEDGVSSEMHTPPFQANATLSWVLSESPGRPRRTSDQAAELLSSVLPTPLRPPAGSHPLRSLCCCPRVGITRKLDHKWNSRDPRRHTCVASHRLNGWYQCPAWPSDHVCCSSFPLLSQVCPVPRGLGAPGRSFSPPGSYFPFLPGSRATGAPWKSLRQEGRPVPWLPFLDSLPTIVSKPEGGQAGEASPPAAHGSCGTGRSDHHACGPSLAAMQ